MAYSIENEQDGSAAAAEVEMLRAASPAKAALIVEGPSDAKLFKSIVNLDSCEIVIGWGKKNCIIAIGILNHRSVIGALAIVDKDYDDFIKQRYYVENLLFTDDHDVESMLFLSPSLDKIVNEMGSPHKIRDLNAAGRNIRSDVMNVAHSIGVARLHSLSNNLDLRFKDLKFKSISKKLEFDLISLFAEIKNHSQKPHILTDDYIACVNTWMDTNHDRWLMCCGHDLASILGISLQSVWGTNNYSDVTCEIIERELRLGFERAYFQKTDLYKSIRVWEMLNVPYVVLDF